MNPLFRKLFTQKRTRVRDPDAPPPPTLLGQVKELRTTKEAIDMHSLELVQLRNRIADLEAKSRRMGTVIDGLRSWMSRFQSK